MLSPPRTFKSVVFLIDSYAQKVLLSVTITFLSGVDSSYLRRNCHKFAAPKNAKNDRFFTDLNHLILECVCGKKGHYSNECPEKDQNEDKGNGKMEEKEEQTRVQMLLVACESGDLDDENAGFFSTRSVFVDLTWTTGVHCWAHQPRTQCQRITGVMGAEPLEVFDMTIYWTRLIVPRWIQHGFFWTTSPLSTCSTTHTYYKASEGATGTWTFIVMLGWWPPISLATCQDMGRCGTMPVGLQTSYHWLGWRNDTGWRTTVRVATNSLWWSQMDPYEPSRSQHVGYTTWIRHTTQTLMDERASKSSSRW